MCSQECCKQIPIKRYFLPGIGIIAMLPFEQFQDFIFFPLIVSVASFILFWNFPKIVYYTASKPLYYEDLFIDIKQLPNYEVNEKVKSHFKFILENAVEKGIYKPVDYKNKPKGYCGMTITDNPFYDL